MRCISAGSFRRSSSPSSRSLIAWSRLTLDSLAKYVIAESPNRPVSELVLRPDPVQDAAIKQKLVDDIAPRAVRSNGGNPLCHVGALFARLHELFKSGLDDTDFRTGRGDLQATWRDWGYEAPPGTGGKTVLVEALAAASASELRQGARGCDPGDR